ncbi:MAG: M23 family metallopeptidase [Opitutae bacterium]
MGVWCIPRFFWALALGQVFLLDFALANPIALAWPTPNPSFAQGLGYHSFLQKTGPDKDFTSGAFGCVRNHGYKFHEGIDLFPIQSSPRGYAKDSVFAAMDGKVAYLSHSPKESAYGKYIVLEHEQFQPIFYSLYAHLEEISEGLTINDKVNVAQPIGKMGNTASFTIPLERSHLHFEIGIRLSNHFDLWYNRQQFNTPNKHNNYNGYNLVGLDPLQFYSAYQKISFATPRAYLDGLPTVTKIQVLSQNHPYLVRRNPSLILNPESSQPVNSWICSFGPFGFPLYFEKSSDIPNQPIRVLSYDEKNDSGRCRKLIHNKNGKLYPSDQLGVYLELIFLD